MIPINLGTLIYTFWRGINFIDPMEKIFPLFDSSHVPNWIVYNLPDGLWYYSLQTTLIFIWGETNLRNLGVWTLIAISLAFLSEISQHLKLIPGTFDWKDLLSYAIASLVCCFNFSKNYNIHI